MVKTNVPVGFDPEDLERIDSLHGETGPYQNRSQLIRDLIFSQKSLEDIESKAEA